MSENENDAIPAGWLGETRPGKDAWKREPGEGPAADTHQIDESAKRARDIETIKKGGEGDSKQVIEKAARIAGKKSIPRKMRELGTMLKVEIDNADVEASEIARAPRLETNPHLDDLKEPDTDDIALNVKKKRRKALESLYEAAPILDVQVTPLKNGTTKEVPYFGIRSAIYLRQLMAKNIVDEFKEAKNKTANLIKKEREEGLTWDETVRKTATHQEIKAVKVDASKSRAATRMDRELRRAASSFEGRWMVKVPDDELTQGGKEPENVSKKALMLAVRLMLTKYPVDDPYHAENIVQGLDDFQSKLKSGEIKISDVDDRNYID